MKATSLFERQRPQTWDAVIGQPKAIAALCRLRNAGGLGGRAYWVSGISGCGKTSIGRLIANEVAGRGDTEEIDAKDLTRDKIREMQRVMATANTAFGGLWKDGGIVGAWIINEAHSLRESQVQDLLTALEPRDGIPPGCVVIFTTTKEGQESLFEDCADAGPLLHRCTVLKLTNQGLSKPFAERAKAIAEAEGLDGRDIGDYVRLANRCRNSLRAMLSEIEAGVMLAD